MEAYSSNTFSEIERALMNSPGSVLRIIKNDRKKGPQIK